MSITLDRLEFLSAISFLKHVIPKGSNTGMNCIFCHNENGKLILTASDSIITKKVPLLQPNLVEGAKDPKPVPVTFMLPRAELFAFEKMMEEHKVECKKLGKGDPNFLFIEISSNEMRSNGGKVPYEQPRHEFISLEHRFEIEQVSADLVPTTSGDLNSVISGFNNSKRLVISFGDNIVHFKEDETDYEAVMIPYVEKVEEKKKKKNDDPNQITTDQK